MAARTEIDILWVTAGLGCDGDTIAMTAATQPSLEDLIFGALPFVPRIKLHNPFLACENGDEFMEVFHRAAEGGLAPFILVIEGSIPNEKNKPEGYWATFGTDQKTGQPILTCDWIDRLAPRAWAVIAANDLAVRNGSGLCRTQPMPRYSSVGRPRRLETPRPKDRIFTNGERPLPISGWLT